MTTAPLPEAVTCLFTDMQDHMTLSGLVGPTAWQRIAVEHDRRITRCIKDRDGKAEREEGDSFFAVFPNSTAALNCAIAIQRQFPQEGKGALVVVEPNGSAHPVQVRVGVYRGGIDIQRTRQGTFRSREVGLAQRLMSCANGGQILASGAAYNEARHYIEQKWGEYPGRFVGSFAGPVDLYELQWDGKARPIKAPPWAPEWLLRETNKFIGRDAYLADIVAWLKGDRPLLLLWGQGGIGKTRLAAQAVRHPEIGGHFEGHIYGVALDREVGLDPTNATVRRLSALIAQAMNAPESLVNTLLDADATPDDRIATDRLIDYLQRRFPRQEFLLVLDNFESAYSPSARTFPSTTTLLASLVQRVRGLRCLVTCRIHFNLAPHSQAIRVDGLQIPGEAEEEMERYDGYRLFRERALQNDPDLDLSDRAALARILRATEGNALGIELVAARANTPFMTLEAIATKLEASRLDMQRPDPDTDVFRSDAADRHSSLETCFDWSYRLLPEKERSLYPRLSIFPADFAPEAAQEIAEIPTDGLARWVHWSLLTESETKTRALLRPALREFAERRLPPEERDALQSRFVAYYGAAARNNTNMNNSVQRTLLCTELHNLHAAAETILKVPAASAAPAFDLVWLGLALWRIPLGARTANLQRAIGCYEAALRVRTEKEFPQDWAMTQNNLGATYQVLPTGDRGANLQRAIGCYEAALRVYTEKEFPQQWAMTQNNLGNTYQVLPTGDRGANLQRAIGCYEAALRVYTEKEFPQQWAMTQFNLALALADSGDREAAQQAMQRAAAGYRGVGMPRDAQDAEDWLARQGG